MRTPRLKPSAVALAVALAGLAPAGVVSAQQTEQAQETVLDEIVVKGIRRSLRQSMDIKRGEDGVVDAITAEDIGKFPDANLAESLQRITGVSIDRQNNEGNQISVRGLGPSFNLVTLNGRQMPVASSPEQENIASATQSRAFNFSEIAAESVSGVNVYKTVRANHATGGIGATVDIRTAKPFDFDGTKTLLSVAGIHDSSVEEGSSLTPEVGALFATQLSDSFAILLNGSYSEREFTDKEERTNGWQRITPTGDANEFAILGQVADLSGVSQLYRPNTNISEVAENERKRLNGQLVLQFRPSDNLEATIDYTLSRYEVSEKRFQTGMFGDPVNHGVQSLTFDQNGTFTSYAFSGAADFLSYENELNIENDSIGLNLEWQVNDKLSLFFDAHTSESESQPDGERNDLLFLLQGAQNVNFAFNYGSDAPFSVAVDDSNAQTQLANNVPGLLAFLGGPSQTLQLNSFLDPAGFAPLGTFARNISILNEVDQAQVGGTWEFGSDTGLISADFGASKTDYTVNTNSISSNFVFQGIGVDPATFSSSCATAFCPIDSPLRGQIGLGGGTGLGGFGTIARVSSPSALAEAFPIPLSSIDPAVARTRIEEESTAFYLNLNFELQFGDMPAKLAVGGRYEDTDVTGVSFQNLPLALRTSSPTEQEVLQSTEEIPFTLQGDYSEFLPAIDLSLETSENTVVRALLWPLLSAS